MTKEIRDLGFRRHQRQCDYLARKMSTPDTIAYGDYRLSRSAKRGRDPDRCLKSAKYKIGKKYYCSNHAGKIALNMIKGERL